jgi:hypothetical protein
MPLLFLSQDDAFTDSTISSESCPYNGCELTGQRSPRETPQLYVIVPCAANCWTVDSKTNRLIALHTTDRLIPKVTITPPPENDRVPAQSLKPLQRLMA